MEAQSDGATLITIDPRLSNTSAKANLWLPAYSGTEGALLLAMVRILLEEDLYDKAFVRDWVNWRDYLQVAAPGTARNLRELHRDAEGAIRAVHAGVRGGGNRRGRRADRRSRARHRQGRQPVRDAQLARRGGRKPVGLADHALPLPARRADRQRRHRRRREPARHQQVRPEAPEPAAAARNTGTSSCSRASSRSRSTK